MMRDSTLKLPPSVAVSVWDTGLAAAEVADAAVGMVRRLNRLIKKPIDLRFYAVSPSSRRLSRHLGRYTRAIWRPSRLASQITIRGLQPI